MTIQEIIVAKTDKDFDLLFIGSARIAKFITAADSERFSEKNLTLTEQMEAATSRIYGEKAANENTCVGYDWWPDHTRHIECDTQSFSQELFNSLHNLLAGEYCEWRIQVVVYQDLMNGHTMIGSVAIWSDKLLIDHKLYKWIINNSFDFGPSATVLFAKVDEVEILKPRYTLLDDLD